MTVAADDPAVTRFATFSPDLPITSARHDLLNRSGFAAAARAIRGWTQEASLVIGLFGDWGSGKSSLKNMILESLNADAPEDERITVVEFNPWQINDRDGLMRAFFNDVGAALARPWPGEDQSRAKQRAAKWKTYGSYLSLGAWLTKSAREVLRLLGVPFVDDILQGVERCFAESAEVTKQGTEGLEARSEVLNKTLFELKQEVHEALRSLPRPLLVVLDDVDRLTRQEICLLFQLIKANADFPNLIYLVLAQRGVLVRALEEIAPDHGEAFLEKIVQVSLTVPRIEGSQLKEILFAGLRRFLQGNAIEDRFDRDRWTRLCLGGVLTFFENLRDVNRFLSSFGFHVGVFRSGNSFEVNPVDLIAVEVLRVFVPEVYERLPQMKHILTDQPRLWREEELEQDKAQLERLLKAAPEDSRAAVRGILENLFPSTSAVLSGFSHSDASNNWFPELRICSHKVFERYFQLALPSGDISQAELDEVISLIADREALRKKFSDLKSRGLLDVLLDRLDDYKDRLPVDGVESFVTALFDLDVDADDELLALRLSPQTHLLRIVYSYLQREPDQTRRRQILDAALAKTTGLATPIVAVSELTKASEPGLLFTQQSDVHDLQRQAVQKIKEAAASGRLAKEKQLADLLAVWNHWGDPAEVRGWVAELVRNPEGLLGFLGAFKQTVRTYGSFTAVPEERHYYRLSDLENYIDVAALTERVDSLDTQELPPEDQRNIKLLREALARRRVGEPDDPLAQL